MLAVIVTEALTQLVVHSDIVEPIRSFLQNRFDWLGRLVSCGYCFSVWAAMPCAYFMAPLTKPTPHFYLNLVIWVLVIHRLSNFLDDFVDRYLTSVVQSVTIGDEMFAEADQHFGIEREIHEASDVSLSDSEQD